MGSAAGQDAAEPSAPHGRPAWIAGDCHGRTAPPLPATPARGPSVKVGASLPHHALPYLFPIGALERALQRRDLRPFPGGGSD
jgi:hypothetical protein